MKKTEPDLRIPVCTTCNRSVYQSDTVYVLPEDLCDDPLICRHEYNRQQFEKQQPQLTGPIIWFYTPMMKLESEDKATSEVLKHQQRFNQRYLRLEAENDELRWRLNLMRAIALMAIIVLLAMVLR